MADYLAVTAYDWFATGKSQADCGNMSNNVTVRIKRV